MNIRRKTCPYSLVHSASVHLVMNELPITVRQEMRFTNAGNPLYKAVPMKKDNTT